MSIFSKASAPKINKIYPNFKFRNLCQLNRILTDKECAFLRNQRLLAGTGGPSNFKPS